MRFRAKAIGVTAVIASISPASASDSPSVPILDNSGKVIGSLDLRPASGGVLLRIKAKDLPPGLHGMHIHAVGDCSKVATFEHAGPHIDPAKKPHGFLHPGGPHEGNLPNLIVHADGSADVELYSQLVQLDDGTASLRDADGSALIIHASADDHLTQPIGGSGGRIACAAIKR